jgi:CubicO group peptidase (beta-lactamase class C family)
MLKLRFLSLWLLACTAAASAASGSVFQPDERSEKVDKLFSPWDTAETPGAAVAVIKDGEIIYQNAYGMADLERDVPLSPKSLSDIASISKQFTALSILMLQDQGKLSLDDDIRRYLPEFPHYGQTITIRHLIHHTGGLRDYMDLMELAGMPWENSYHQLEIVDLVARQKGFNFKPGDEYSYSNSGYLLLAEIILAVSGQTLGEFTQQHIFKPLNMKVSHFYDDFKRIVKNRALSYSQKEAGGYTSLQYIFDVVGDTGLLTNIEDLYLWDQNFYHNKLGKGGPKLIEQMLAPGQLNSGEKIDYAFGLRLSEYRGLKVVSHGGGAAGYSTAVVRFPDQKFTAIVLSNLGEFSSTNLAKQVADVYLADEYTAGPEPAGRRRERPDPPTPVELKLSADELDAYRGHYYSAELDVIYIVRPVDGSLTYHFEYSRVDIPLVPTGRNEWVAGRTKLSFLRDGETVTGLNLSWGGQFKDIYFEKTRSGDLEEVLSSRLRDQLALVAK